jgi:hypothetical protein
VVNGGEEDFLDLILAVNYTLRLYKNDPVSGAMNEGVIDAFINTSFTEADFTGYAAINLTGGSWTTVPGDPCIGLYAQQSFTSSANQTAQTIYGYTVNRTSDNRLEWFEHFDVPSVVEFNGDQINVQPRITLKDEVN